MRHFSNHPIHHILQFRSMVLKKKIGKKYSLECKYNTLSGFQRAALPFSDFLLWQYYLTLKTSAHLDTLLHSEVHLSDDQYTAIFVITCQKDTGFKVWTTLTTPEDRTNEQWILRDMPANIKDSSIFSLGLVLRKIFHRIKQKYIFLLVTLHYC